MSENFFSNCRIFILPHGILQKRIQLFERQIAKYNGEVIRDLCKYSPTHILIDDDLFTNPVRVRNALKSAGISIQSLNCELVAISWLCCCLKKKKFLDINQFSFRNKAILENDSREVDCATPVKELEIPSPVSNSISFKDDNLVEIKDGCETNRIIINELQKLADAYRVRGDKWRHFAYEKAVTSLKSYTKEITNVNELRSLPHVSTKMLDNISDILENGCSSKAENVCNDEKTKILDVFSKIWGAGPVTAQLWYQKGLRTLDDVKMKGNLTFSQKIGLKYYNEIQETIPREEVEEIIQVVKTVSLQLEPSVRIVPCGSYRRGKQICGDVDVLLIVKDHYNHGTLIPKIIRELKTYEFLIDDLVGSVNTSCSKYLGLCKLKRENSKIRRIDLFAVSEKNSACALLHYTGSALFNRGIRLHASKMNMHLSEYFLRMNNEILRTPSEESVFEYLGIRYRPPEERQFFDAS